MQKRDQLRFSAYCAFQEHANAELQNPTNDLRVLLLSIILE